MNAQRNTHAWITFGSHVTGSALSFQFSTSKYSGPMLGIPNSIPPQRYGLAATDTPMHFADLTSPVALRLTLWHIPRGVVFISVHRPVKGRATTDLLLRSLSRLCTRCRSSYLRELGPDDGQEKSCSLVGFLCLRRRNQGSM